MEDQAIQQSIEDKQNTQTILLIDIDNCPNEINKLIENLEKYNRIIICYGGQIPKISLNLVYAFATAISEKKLEIVGMKKKGKNAADFGLCFLAGRLSAQIPSSNFTILSNDTDLDHLVNLLEEFGHSVQRIGVTKEETASIPVKSESNETAEVNPTPSEVLAVAQEYYQHTIGNNKTNRPTTTSSLLNSIRAFSRNRYPNQEQVIFDYLQHKGYFKSSASGKIEYS